MRVPFPRVSRVVLLIFALVIGSRVASGDDKDLLVRTSAPSNVLIVFGNSQTTTQPIQGSTSSWDGDADSQTSKMGASKRVVTRFVSDKAGQYNFGLTSFSHNPNAGSISIFRKHWLYAPLTVDYPSESWQEPAGTIDLLREMRRGLEQQCMERCVRLVRKQTLEFRSRHGERHAHFSGVRRNGAGAETGSEVPLVTGNVEPGPVSVEGRRRMLSHPIRLGADKACDGRSHTVRADHDV